MPQILVADVIVATMLQRYEFFLKLPNFLATILQENAKYAIIHLFIYSNTTGRF